MKLEYNIDKKDENKKLGDILKNKLNISSRLLIKLKKCEGAIQVNGKNTFTNYLVNVGDNIQIFLDNIFDLEEYKLDESKYSIYDKQLDIVYEDEYFLCVNKEAMMATHQCSNHRGNTLADAVYTYFKTKHIKFNINLVNRLDLQTSGIVIFAKHPYIQELFSKMMTENQINKSYIAVVNGIIKEGGIIEENIARKENSIIERCVNKDGEYAKTEYNVIENNIENNYTVLNIRLYTGRTHQIRVHMSFIGHSLLGDYLYNKDENYNRYINRTALHAYKLEFKHPITNEKIKIYAKIPKDISYLISKFDKIM